MKRKKTRKDFQLNLQDVSGWVMAWFERLNGITLSIEETNRRLEQMIRQNRHWIAQNEARIAQKELQDLKRLTARIGNALIEHLKKEEKNHLSILKLHQYPA
jgi:hypothetical protein